MLCILRALCFFLCVCVASFVMCVSICCVFLLSVCVNGMTCGCVVLNVCFCCRVVLLCLLLFVLCCVCVCLFIVFRCVFCGVVFVDCWLSLSQMK